MASSNLFGWEMIFKAVKFDINKDSDYIVAFVHWFLVQRANLRCLGNGKDMRLRQNEERSEMLPTDWNRNEKTYALKYVLNDNVYVLLGTNTEESFIINLLSAKKLDLSNVAFHTETTAGIIKVIKGTITPELQEIIDRFTKELLNPVFESDTRTAETQTVSPALLPSGHIPPPALFRERDEMRDYRDLREPHPLGGLAGVGRADLDPFAVGGGGMLFQPPNTFPPMHPNEQPPGNLRHPPGARFDPFGPPGANLRRPNNDHFRPPGFDDMFM